MASKPKPPPSKPAAKKAAPPRPLGKKPTDKSPQPPSKLVKKPAPTAQQMNIQAALASAVNERRDTERKVDKKSTPVAKPKESAVQETITEVAPWDDAPVTEPKEPAQREVDKSVTLNNAVNGDRIRPQEQGKGLSFTELTQRAKANKTVTKSNSPFIGKFGLK